MIMSKMDGDARGGGALSIKQVTGKPIAFILRVKSPTHLNASIPTEWPNAFWAWAMSLASSNPPQSFVLKKSSKKKPSEWLVAILHA